MSKNLKTKMTQYEKFECPICMDDIESNKNCVTTECGHCFHTNCLMKSIAHNGFRCPYCRSAMAEEVSNNDEDESEYEDDEDEDEDEDEFDDEDDCEEDYILRGFRIFMNNINGEQQDESDIEEETELPVPTIDIIINKLSQQGVTMEDFVKILLLNHKEYDSQDEEFERLEDEIFGKMRIIISNYNPIDNPIEV